MSRYISSYQTEHRDALALYHIIFQLQAVQLSYGNHFRGCVSEKQCNVIVEIFNMGICELCVTDTSVWKFAQMLAMHHHPRLANANGLKM